MMKVRTKICNFVWKDLNKTLNVEVEMVSIYGGCATQEHLQAQSMGAIFVRCNSMCQFQKGGETEFFTQK